MLFSMTLGHWTLQNIVFGCTFQGLSCSKFIFESMWVLHETNDVSIDINTFLSAFLWNLEANMFVHLTGCKVKMTQ